MAETIELAFSQELSGHVLARYCRYCEQAGINILRLEYVCVAPNEEVEAAQSTTLLRLSVESKQAQALPENLNQQFKMLALS